MADQDMTAKHDANFVLAPCALGEIGTLQVRLATTPNELDAAQALRYRVFSAEFGATFTSDNAASKRDTDAFDALCDHLVVIDRAVKGDVHDQIVGTYRVRAKDGTDVSGRDFYSQAEFDVNSLIDRHRSRVFLELGRSCVLPAYRGKRTIELLWQGIWAYCRQSGVDAMFGCASFHGTDPDRHLVALSFLHHFTCAKGAWRVEAQPERRLPIHYLPRADITTKSALAAMPPLIKGYLRLGAQFGDGAVVDSAFNSIDVMVVLPVEAINARYVNYYGENADRFVA